MMLNMMKFKSKHVKRALEVNNHLSESNKVKGQRKLDKYKSGEAELTKLEMKLTDIKRKNAEREAEIQATAAKREAKIQAAVAEWEAKLQAALVEMEAEAWTEAETETDLETVPETVPESLGFVTEIESESQFLNRMEETTDQSESVITFFQ